MATKKWYVRKENTSRYINASYVYYVGGDDSECWTTSISKAKSYRRKSEATVLSLELGGEVYGE